MPLLHQLKSVFRPPRAAVVPAIIALAIIVFAWLGAEMGEGETSAFDSAILLALRQPGDLGTPIGPHWLKPVLVDLTALGGGVVLTLVALVAIGSLLVQRKAADALYLAFALGGGGALGVVLKAGYARPRPGLVAHLVDVTSPSFPSAHAMNSAIVYLTIGVLLARAMPDRRLGAYVFWVGVFLTLTIGMSRVYLGVHWPTDVLAGWAVGAAWAGLCWLGRERLRTGRADPRPGS